MAPIPTLWSTVPVRKHVILWQTMVLSLLLSIPNSSLVTHGGRRREHEREPAECFGENTPLCFRDRWRERQVVCRRAEWRVPVIDQPEGSRAWPDPVQSSTRMDGSIRRSGCVISSRYDFVDFENNFKKFRKKLRGTIFFGTIQSTFTACTGWFEHRVDSSRLF